MNRRTQAIAAALVAPALAGCWPQPGGNAGGQNYNGLETALTADNVDALAEDWSAPGTVTAVWGSTAYGAGSGDVRALDTETGAVRWASPLPTYAPASGGTTDVLSGPAVAAGGDDLVLSSSHEFHAPPEGQLTREHFGLRWDRVSGEVSGILSTYTGPATLNIVPAGDIVVYETPDTLEVVSALDGIPHPTNPDLTRSLPLWSAPSVTADAPPVVAGDSLLDADGGVLRSFVAAGCGAATCAPTGTLDLGGAVTALAAGPPGVALALTDPTGSQPPSLIAADRAATTVAWRAELPAAGTSLAVVRSTVYVAAGDEVLAFDTTACASTCAPAWSGDLPAAAAGNVAVAGGGVYAGAADGSVSAFPAAGCGGAGSCAALATVAVDGPPQHLVVAAGHLFVTAFPAAGPRTTAFAPAA